MEFDGSDYTALICAVCVKELSKALQFRNKAIKAEKYFKRSDWPGRDEVERFEPEIRIKLEDENDVGRIKSEPFDDDPNYEFMHNIDTMMGNHHTSVLLQSTSFVDVKQNHSYEDFDEKIDHKKRSKPFVRYVDEDFGSSSGVVRCKLCMKSFTSVSSQQNHMKSVHREMSESEMHKCKYCNRFFKLKIYLNRHLLRIHGTKNKSTKARSDSKKKSSQESIFNREDVSLYCEVSFVVNYSESCENLILCSTVVQTILYDPRKSSKACPSEARIR